MDEHKIRLFLLNNAAVDAALQDTLISVGLSSEPTNVEQALDRLLDGYIPQFAGDLRAKAERMSRFYALFYLIENDIRDLIEETLEETEGEDWWQKAVPAQVQDSAKRSRQREVDNALTLRSDRMIDYITFGELGEIIRANWNQFAGIFSKSNIPAVEKVMKSLNMLRGPIAHCGALSEAESVRLKLTIRDWFRLQE
jgi:hypothetical protein